MLLPLLFNIGILYHFSFLEACGDDDDIGVSHRYDYVQK